MGELSKLALKRIIRDTGARAGRQTVKEKDVRLAVKEWRSQSLKSRSKSDKILFW
jgi:histone H3/H4